jgi:hypothetical protein
MSRKSRRRVAMAAGAVLAGAVIPIAAAGTAWADDDTITVAQAEKLAKAGEQVDISVNGKTIKDTCMGACTADSGAVGEHNKAIAIGAGSEAEIENGATDSTAKASGGGEAKVEDSGTATVSHDVATANGVNSEAIVVSNAGSGNVMHDVATVSDGGTAEVENFNGAGNVTYDAAHASNASTAEILNEGGSGAISHDTVTASGFNASGDSQAEIVNESGGTEPVSNDHATATNGGLAEVSNAGDSTVAVMHDAAMGNNGAAELLDAGSSKATAVNTDGLGASVIHATDSTAKAEGAGSVAVVEGSASSYITGSSAAETEGGTTGVTASDTHEMNGMVVPHVEMTPLTDVHEMHIMPPTPLP